MYPVLLFFFLKISSVLSFGDVKDMAWTGGPLHMDCEYGADFFTVTRQHVADNVIGVKAVMYMEHVYLLTPRLRPGILSTVWLVVGGRRGPELQPYPDQRAHRPGYCGEMQNSIDMQLDHFGNLWILDSGVIETMTSPRCTCPPKVVVVNLMLHEITRVVDMTTVVESTSALHNIAVEHTITGKDFVYVSDASSGKILVFDVAEGSGWSVVACAPASGLHTALVKRGPGHTALILMRTPYHSIVEIDTAILKMKHSETPVTVYGEGTKSLTMLGWGPHQVFLRHTCCSDVLAWHFREPFNVSRLINIHQPPPTLRPVSVTTARRYTLVLDTNYAETANRGLPTYHRITFIKK